METTSPLLCTISSGWRLALRTFYLFLCQYSVVFNCPSSPIHRAPGISCVHTVGSLGNGPFLQGLKKHPTIGTHSLLLGWYTPPPCLSDAEYGIDTDPTPTVA